MASKDQTDLLRDLLSQRILVIDGAMGSLIQQYKLTEADFRGERFRDHAYDVKGNSDLLVLTRPDVIGAGVGHALLFGSLSLAYGARSTKGALVREGRLEISSEGISFRRQVVASPGELRQGFTVPTEEGLLLRFDRSFAVNPLFVRVPDRATADAELATLGFDAKHTAARMRIASALLSMPVSQQTATILGPLLLLLPIALLLLAGLGPGAWPLAVAAFAAFILYTFVIAFAPTTVLVGTDGFEHTWLGTRAFVPFANVTAVETYKEWAGCKMQRGVRWIQGRATWTLSTLYNTVEKKQEWLDGAKLGYDFLNKHCFDTDGQMFFHVTRDGRPIRKRRYFFSETFYVIAAAAYAKASGDEQAAINARKVFGDCIAYMRGEKKLESKFTGTRPAKTIGPLMIMINTAQKLRSTIGDEKCDNLITEWIAEIERDFVKDDIKCVMEQVTPDGSIIDHIDGRTLNPGHAIEGAWFSLHEVQEFPDRHTASDEQRLVPVVAV